MGPNQPFTDVSTAIDEVRAGRMIVVVDDEDRENEGDLTLAAEKVSPEAINFMAKYGRGLVCLAMTEERLDHLRLGPMTAENTSNYGTAFCAAIDETEQGADLEVAGDDQQTPRLVRAHHQRYLLRLANVIDLARQIQSPQRHPEQEPQPGHDAVAVADAHTGLGQVQLEPADIFGRRRVGRAIKKRGKPLAAVNVTPLRPRRELPCVHVFDHAMTQRGDGIRTHGTLLPWMR